MRSAWVLVLLLSITTWAGAETVDPAEAWRPLGPYIGSWKGTRSGAHGAVKVTREYEAARTNHQLEITENGGGRPRGGVWGVVSLDPQRQALVLRQFAEDGSASELVLAPEHLSAGQLVFTSPESETARTRITYERAGARNFVERIERSAEGGPFTVVSETRFARTD